MRTTLFRTFIPPWAEHPVIKTKMLVSALENQKT